MRTSHGLLLALALGACATTATDTPDSSAPEIDPPPPLVDPARLPAGTLLDVQLADTLHAERARVGDRFTVTVTAELKTTGGQVAVPAGTVITGLITGVDDTDHAGDTAYVRLNFVRITLGESNHPFAAEIVRAGDHAARSSGRSAEQAGIDAVAGAVGAIISGEARTVLESAALGTGAGTIVSLGADPARALLPRGTPMVLRTNAEIELRR